MSHRSKTTDIAFRQALGKHVLASYPLNGGILLYGSILFEPANTVNDVDVVVITRENTRKRVVDCFGTCELHINVVSATVFIDDIRHGRFGEYYLNKVMTPTLVLSESDALRDVLALAKRTKAIQTLVLAGKSAPPFSTMDLVKFITCIRVFQFPHYLASAISMFANTSSPCFVRLLSDYSIVLQELVKEGYVSRLGVDRFTRKSVHRSSASLKEWHNLIRMPSLYWHTFAGLHQCKMPSIDNYLARQTMNLQRHAKTRWRLINEMFTNPFTQSIAVELLPPLGGGKHER